MNYKSNLQFRCALVTGASSGIGMEFVKALSQRYGCDIILAARRADRLELLKGEIEDFYRKMSLDRRISVMPVDLSDLAAREIFCDEIDKGFPELDLLVNNAGFGLVSEHLSSPIHKNVEMVELNNIAPLVLCQRILPRMVKRGFGAVINVCSTASFQPMPWMATYGATKAFLHSYSVALDAELRPYGIRVLAHCPGPTRSEFHLVSGLSEKISLIPGMNAEDVVNQALNALERGNTTIVNGIQNKVFKALSDFLPTRISTRIVRRLLRPYASKSRTQS